MAKKRVKTDPGGDQPLLMPECADEIPDVVAEAADSYLRAMRQKKQVHRADPDRSGEVH